MQHANDDYPAPYWLPLAVLGVAVVVKVCVDWRYSCHIECSVKCNVADIKGNRKHAVAHFAKVKTEDDKNDLIKEFKRKTFWQTFFFGVNAAVLCGLQLDFDITATAVLALSIAWFVVWTVLDLYSIKSKTTIHSDRVWSLKADDIYQNFLGDLWTTVCVGFGQIMLLGMYVWGVQRDRPDLTDIQVYVFYWFGVTVQMCFLVKKDYSKKLTEQRRFWRSALISERYDFVAFSCEESSPRSKLLALAKRMDVKPDTTTVQQGLKKFDLWVRYFLSRIVNEMGLWVILVGLPVQLANSSDPTDFVLNAVAAFFIIELDDLEKSVEFKKVAVAKDKTKDLEEGKSPSQEGAVVGALEEDHFPTESKLVLETGSDGERKEDEVPEYNEPEEFGQLMKNSKSHPVLIYFSATWCPPCHLIAPVFDIISKHYGNSIEFARVDVDEAKQVASSCGIEAIPTFHLYNDGQKMGQVIGADLEALVQLLEDWKGGSDETETVMDYGEP